MPAVQRKIWQNLGPKLYQLSLLHAMKCISHGDNVPKSMAAGASPELVNKPRNKGKAMENRGEGDRRNRGTCSNGSGGQTPVILLMLNSQSSKCKLQLQQIHNYEPKLYVLELDSCMRTTETEITRYVFSISYHSSDDVGVKSKIRTTIMENSVCGKMTIYAL